MKLCIIVLFTSVLCVSSQSWVGSMVDNFREKVAKKVDDYCTNYLQRRNHTVFDYFSEGANQSSVEERIISGIMEHPEHVDIQSRIQEEFSDDAKIPVNSDKKA